MLAEPKRETKDTQLNGRPPRKRNKAKLTSLKFPPSFVTICVSRCFFGVFNCCDFTRHQHRTTNETKNCFNLLIFAGVGELECIIGTRAEGSLFTKQKKINLQLALVVVHNSRCFVSHGNATTTRQGHKINEQERRGNGKVRFQLHQSTIRGHSAAIEKRGLEKPSSETIHFLFNPVRHQSVLEIQSDDFNRFSWCLRWHHIDHRSLRHGEDDVRCNLNRSRRKPKPEPTKRFRVVLA